MLPTVHTRTGGWWSSSRCIRISDPRHEWGEVLAWEPPLRVDYLWHLFFDRSEATEITVTFTEIEDGSRVRLVQTGFEKLGDEIGQERRRRTSTAWVEVTGHYREHSSAPGK